ncbi:MAG: sulfotransferase [Fuerstiella sp.]
MNEAQTFPTSQPASWAPDFIGIGAEKAATTWLWANLNAHPEVEMSQPKELNFFNVSFDKGSDWYQQHFRQSVNCLQGEISPWYMDDAQCAARMAAACPNAQLLVMLRDPFERAFSHLLHDSQNAFGGIADLTAEQLQSLTSKSDDYVRRSCYSKCLAPFLKYFKRSQIDVQFYDDVKSQPLQTIQNVFRFLNVDADFVPENCDRAVNKSQNYRSVVLHKVASSVSQTAQAFPVTRDIMDWIHRRTTWRERAIEMLMVDSGRPSLSAVDVFSEQQLDAMTEDTRRLGDLLAVVVPDHWAQQTAAIAA